VASNESNNKILRITVRVFLRVSSIIVRVLAVSCLLFSKCWGHGAS
jgi:hypothetical protein